MTADAAPSAWALHTDASLEEVNRLLPTLEAAGVLGLVEENGMTTVYLPTPVDDLPLEGRWEAVADVDWSAAWKAGLDPVTVGAVTVAPPWAARPGDLVVDPGQAFGTGHHETTTACLEALQRLGAPGASVEGLASGASRLDCSVLDVGTGSGVLAIAAARLGAPAVVAVDTDPASVAASRRNAEANGVAVDVRQGSVDVVGGRFELVLANLDTSTVTRLAAELVDRVAPGGALVVSGVSNEREEEATAALRAAGAAPTTHRGREWTTLVARPGAPS